MAAHGLSTSSVLLEFPLDLSLGTRDRLEALIESLVALLDQADGDPDFEPTEDLEPSIGGFGYATYDLELDEGDAEPSLGWTQSESEVGFYGSSEAADRELDESDDEAALGWGEEESSVGLLSVGFSDRELDDADAEDDHRDVHDPVPILGKAVA